MTTKSPRLSRRSILASGAALPTALALGSTASASPAKFSNPDYPYEVTYTDDEWKERLSEIEYSIMREGGTEPRQSSLLAFEKREGTYSCKGCDLEAFKSEWKVIHFDIGWVFFTQAIPDTILTGIDLEFDSSAMNDDPATSATIECHCRRCGSHLGHILHVRGDVLHCLNGTSLVFSPV